MKPRLDPSRSFVVVLSLLLAAQSTISPTLGARAHPSPLRPAAVASPHDTFQPGDLVISVGSQIQWRLPDWTLNATLSMGGSAVGLAFDPLGNLYAADVSGGRVAKFSPRGEPLGTFASGMSEPSAIVTDGSGHIFVGERKALNGIARVYKFDLAGQRLAEYQLPSGHTMAYATLASDGCTLHYTPNTQYWIGASAFLFDVCTGAPLPGGDGGGEGSSGGYQAIALLPDSSVLIAFVSPFGTTYVGRYVGINTTQTYDPGGPNPPTWLRAVAVDPGANTFWTGDTQSGQVYHLNVASGAVLATYSTGTANVAAMAVVGSQSFTPTAPGPPPEQTAGGSLTRDLHALNPTRLEADPVNTLTGSHASQAVDLALPGRGIAFAFIRTYNSQFAGVDGPLGPGWTYSYAAHLVTNPDASAVFHGEGGAQLTFASDGQGGFLKPPGGLSGLAQVTGGYELTRRDQVRYRFDAAGVLTAMLDRNNNQLTFAYTNGRLTRITDTVGRPIDLTYTPAGRLQTVSDPSPRVVTYGYDPAGRLQSVTDVRSFATTYTYDVAGRLETIRDANNHVVVTDEYAPDGRVSAQTDARGQRGTFAWDAPAETSTYTDARGGVWTDDYDNNLLVRTVDPLGNTTRYVYDSALNVAAVADPRGSVTTYSYDPVRNVIRVLRPGGYPAEEFTYNGRNDVLTAKDGRANTTVYEYDTAGNLTKITAPLTATAQFGRDPAGTGLLVSMTDPRGKTTTYGYDPQANLNRVTTPLGNVTTMTFDAAGRTRTVVDPRGNVTGGNPALYTTTLTFDAAGNLLTVTDPLSNLTTRTYDPVGNLLTVTDPNQHPTAYGYDPANHLLSVTDARNGITAYSYDAVGNVATRTDANNHLTTFGYDLARRPTSATDALTHSWTLTYDSAGNLATLRDANAHTTTYAHDARNRLISTTYAASSTPTAAFGYDANDNRTSMTDGAGTESYTYDALNRMVTATRGADTMQYVYDLAGNVTTRIYAGLQQPQSDYDDDGRLLLVGSAAYTYDPAGNISTFATLDGITARYTFDRAGRLSEVANTTSTATLSRFTYARDAAGNPTAMTSRQATVTYRYDELDRLVEACWSSTTCPGGPPSPPQACVACIGGLLTRPAASTNPPAGETYRRYTYDPVGNRSTEASNAGTTSYLYDAADRLTRATAPGNVVTNYAFDNNGNQTAAGARTFTYDLANRLKTAIVSGTTDTYTYDGDGLRLSAGGPQANKTTKFLWDRSFGLPRLALERNGNGALLRQYWQASDPMVQRVGTTNYNYHYDGLGSVSDMTVNVSSTSVAWNEYYPFGSVRQSGADRNAPATQVLGFAGEQLDSVTGLYHLRARQYDPSTGRFLTPDPRSEPMSDPHVGSYAYVRDGPTRYVDPSGRCVETLLLAFAGPPGAVVGVGSTLFCLALVGLGAAAISGTTAMAVKNAPRIDLHFRDSRPVFDPRPDPEVERAHLQEEIRLSKLGTLESTGGQLPGSGFCAAHPTACRLILVGGGVAFLTGLLFGLRSLVEAAAGGETGTHGEPATGK